MEFSILSVSTTGAKSQPPCLNHRVSNLNHPLTHSCHGCPSQTFKKTPIPCQIETMDPNPDSFVHTRTQLSYKSTFRTVLKDPCNDPSNFTSKHGKPHNLWPQLQESASGDSFIPPVSNINLGDTRIDTFKTSYGSDFASPFTSQARLRSPNRNEDLAKTTQSLTAIYKSAFNRVGE